MTTVRTHMLHAMALMGVLAVLFVVASASLVQPAYASDREELKYNYQAALFNYENAVVEQGRNAADITRVETTIERTKTSIEQARAELAETATTLYKITRDNNALVDLILGSSDFHDAVVRFDMFKKVEDYCYDRIHELSRKSERLDEQRDRLEQRKLQIQDKVANAKQAADDAAAALLDNTHEDGAQFHQKQGADNNCGATSFIVGVNILLHENRYTDNVAVWEGPGFDGDSTADLAYRGGIWLVANGLSGMISIEVVSGDIHTAQEMREQLEQGHIVIVSSGSGSTWQRADGTTADEGSFPDGHWIVFYRYDNGIFYANDSAVDAAKGAGCPYDEDQMQQWLDGRSNHFATVMKKL